jgi:hypothetical protein
MPITAMLVKSKSKSNPAWIILAPPKPRNVVLGENFWRQRIKFDACKSPLGSPTEKNSRCPMESSMLFESVVVMKLTT